MTFQSTLSTLVDILYPLESNENRLSIKSLCHFIAGVTAVLSQACLYGFMEKRIGSFKTLQVGIFLMIIALTLYLCIGNLWRESLYLTYGILWFGAALVDVCLPAITKEKNKALKYC